MLRASVGRVIKATTTKSIQQTPKWTRTLATNTNKSTSTGKGTQGTGANNEGAGLGTGQNQETYKNNDVKGNPVNPSADHKGAHTTKHSQAASVTGQQKPSPTAGTPDAVGASAQGSSPSINAETKPVHNNNKDHAKTHSANTHTTHQTHNKTAQQHEHQSSNTSNTSSMDSMAGAAATAKSKAQDVKNKLQSMMAEAGSEIPDASGAAMVIYAALAAGVFMLLNPDRRYVKRVYKTNELPRLQELAHPTTH